MCCVAVYSEASHSNDNVSTDYITSYGVIDHTTFYDAPIVVSHIWNYFSALQVGMVMFTEILINCNTQHIIIILSIAS